MAGAPEHAPGHARISWPGSTGWRSSVLSRSDAVAHNRHAAAHNRRAAVVAPDEQGD